MIAVLLMLVVAAGIAYPFGQKWLAQRHLATLPVSEEPVEVVSTPESRRAAFHEELCPSCSRLNPPDTKNCIECGQPMPVTNVKKLFVGTNQDDLIREGIQGGILLVLMLIAMAVANFLPIGGKIFILLLTIGALGYRFSRALTS